MTTIGNAMVTAYWWCHRKAHLLNTSQHVSANPYSAFLEQMRQRARNVHLDKVKAQHPNITPGARFDPTIGVVAFADVTLQSGELEATCDLLTKLSSKISTVCPLYEPCIVVGTYQVTADQKLEIAFVGYVLGQIQQQMPATGIIVSANGQTHRVNLQKLYAEVASIINVLHERATSVLAEPPPAFLIDHCDCCQFRAPCLEVAEKEDSLSLLDRMTPKVARAYHKKGVFTVNQLSYTFRPRRCRKPRPNATVQFKFEIQSLAIRTGQIYAQRLPELPKQPVELFLDIEGVPELGFDYLVGVLLNEGDVSSYYGFWADSHEDAMQMWGNALELIRTHPEAPIYHYGSYEPRAIDRFMRACQVDCASVKARLVNINTLVFGRIYFPTRSNGLKDLARHLGVTWTSPDATGLQSLVWRQHWEDTRNNETKEVLLAYNRDDCRALRTLTEELRRIGGEPSSQTNVEFAGKPNRRSTPVGEQIHRQFDTILKSAHAVYAEKKLSFREANLDEQAPARNSGGQPGHHSTYRRISKPTRVLAFPPIETCPNCPGVATKLSKDTFERSIIDIVFTKNGCRKTITRYSGRSTYCPNCKHRYHHPSIDAALVPGHGYRYGRTLQSWVIYQKVALRLSYRLIMQSMLDQFNEPINSGVILNSIKIFGSHYAQTEQYNVKCLFNSPFIHADETKINIQGTEEFVWVFTDGQHVVFRLTETREADFAHQFLKGYQGILISDFYSGYDGVECRQQKCLVHLIRDLNNDLWSAPYDQEFEAFTTEVKNLLAPILEAVRKYGLKTRHLRKFKANVDKFYVKSIDGKFSANELVGKYLKRFHRYRRSLFLFLEIDGIPWHNNMAENAIRPLAVQRKISGSFYKSVAPQYLILLGIAQTCKYADKSFLKFLLSGEMDIDVFSSGKRRQNSSLPPETSELP